MVVLGACGSRETTPGQTEDINDARPQVDFYTEDFVSHKLADTARIRIDNPWGDLRVRSHSGGVVSVTAAVQRIGKNPPEPPEWARSDPDDRSRFELEVRYPQARFQPDRNGRVDLAVYVPEGHPLELSTRDGFIKIKKTANPMRIRSESGDIYVINDGPIAARSGSGRIQVRPMFPGWKSMRLMSRTGKIVAFLPEDMPMKLRAGGTANINSELPVESDGTRHWLDRGIGTGDVDEVRIRTGGSIELYEAIVPPDYAELSISE